jgi:hypothetical protein
MIQNKESVSSHKEQGAEGQLTGRKAKGIERIKACWSMESINSMKKATKSEGGHGGDDDDEGR